MRPKDITKVPAWKEALKKNRLGKKSSPERVESLKGSKNPNWKGGVPQAQSVRAWKQRNKGRVNTYNHTRRALLLGAAGEHTVGEWEILKKQYGYKCPNCNKLEPTIKLTRDHIIPLTRGGSNWIENIQPLCTSCNSSKGSKMKLE